MPALDERGATSTNYLESHLSWQTAFWCLTAVALNTMAQPAGRILGLNSDYSFYIRASPLVCLHSIMGTVFYLITDIIAGHSFADATLRWESRRFGEFRDRDEPSLENLRSNTTARLALFVLSALLPAIKLYSCHGVEFTQTICTVYLTCFVLDEVLNGLAWRSRQLRHYRDSHSLFAGYNHKGFAATAMAFDIGILFYLMLRVACVDRFEDYRAGSLALAFSVPGGVSIARFADDRRTGAGCIAGCICGLTWLSWGVYRGLLPGTVALNACFRVECIGIIIVAAFLICCAISGLPDSLWESWSRRHGALLVRLQAICWLIIGVLMYARVYNAENTYDPSWLHVFG